jgi:hypothetical protein
VLAIVVVMGLAGVVIALVERAARSTRPRRAQRPEAESPAVEEVSQSRPEARRLGFSAPRRGADPESVSPGEWNLWELERLAREEFEGEALEQSQYLFIHLRQFARADGQLPLEFDELVRDSFGGLLDRVLHA